ncbi:hypothetical protein [Dyadobacter sp. CY356]|uniref:hypothetical protein n=1 Tax=Dyadobacter sp. CY356 TaxID=2906442 RepID=UPI001F3DB8AE|nr:hypothetical protein [Dyadobacter sp. CY356]MCF0056857.1 hypothetical protein [Dyadobacter sp. CY356]
MAKNLLKRKISKKKIDDLLIFLQRYITFADQGYNVKFDKEIGALTGNQISMGIREMVLDKAEKKGVEKATISFILSLWETGNYTVSQIASLLKVSEEFVQNTIASK